MTTAAHTPHPDAVAVIEAVGALWRHATEAARDQALLPSLTPAQVRTLRIIARAGAKGITPAAIAAELSVSRPLASDTVRRLEQGGLVERRRTPQDGRSVLISTTARGAAAERSFHSGLAVAMDRAFVQLSTEERAALAAAVPALERAGDLLHGDRGEGETASTTP
ncbi:MarR family transcriptional regulator [Demequina sp. NBRC 110051]|uniref:MarR family transcriptional regulator n=1 Tax=Demequina sp. NBRC 110051 TaxID=1570340 RepID=UPI000A02B6F4|nr:MarR family transcriptional regulator [Demequina sp. NBRC 110051]